MAHRQRDAEFAQFAVDEQRRMYLRARLLTGDADSAQDLVQTTLVKLFVSWHRIDQPAAYARRVLVRSYLAGRRRSRAEQELRALPDAVRPERDPDRVVTIFAALGELAPRTRAVVVLRYWEDLSVEQTATALGCSTGTVKSLASRGLDRLRQLLAGSFEELLAAPSA